MRVHICENKALKKELRDAYLAKESEGGSDELHSQVMSRIRRIGPLGPDTSFGRAFEHLVWRLTPVSAFLVLVLIVLSLNTGFAPNYDYLELLTADLDQPTLTELFFEEKP